MVGAGGTDDVDSSIRAQLEDEVIQEALTSGTDLRQYSQSVEKDLRQVNDLILWRIWDNSAVQNKFVLVPVLYFLCIKN